MEHLVKIIRREERQKLLDEGYIHKSECPRAKEDKKLRELKKANKSLQRKITELQLEKHVNIMMRC